MCDTEKIKTIVEKVFDEKLGALYIDREKHYKHHLFLDDLLAWMDDTKNVVSHTVVKVVVYGFLGALLLGFVVWGKHVIGK